MGFIPGKTVEQAWDELNPTERADVISQVASIINILQSIELSEEQLLKPGPVGCDDCVAQGFTFTDLGAGPFESKADLEAWFNLRLEITQKFHQAPDTAPPFQFDKLVLAHLDITPRNLILGPDGKVWLIDWGNAGIFPDGFEVALLLHRKSQAPEYTEMLLEKLPDMISKHEGLLDQLKWITYALTTGQYLGRRGLHFGQI